MSISTQRYPKPGPIGGRLIREVIGFLKSQGVSLPIASHILVATSGGSDSIGLAHLLIHFGRRIVSRSELSLLHVNHGWRGQESQDDEDFVQSLGQRWNVPVISHKLTPPAGSLKDGLPRRKESWEEEARNGRKAVFSQEAQKRGAWVMTAHQADDLAETVLWRLFTGAARTHGGGVAFRHGVEMRPFLKVRKNLIQDYLKEVGEVYREDSTNSSERFMRARMRAHIMPELERLFPKAVDHLTALALDAQSQSSSLSLSGLEPYEFLLRASGIKARRPHLETILEKVVANRPWYGEIHLPGGWRLVREKKNVRCEKMDGARFQESDPPLERWVLERLVSSQNSLIPRSDAEKVGVG